MFFVEMTDQNYSDSNDINYWKFPVIIHVINR